MSQNVLIILGVAVFTVTFAGVLIYFYAIINTMAGSPEGPEGSARQAITDDLG